MEKIREIMTKEVTCCTPETNLEVAARMMCDYNCGEIPVVDNFDDRKLLGVITDRDITCRTIAQGKNAFKLKVADCMSSPCVTVASDASLEECCALLEAHQIRRVPVVDERGNCCGIVSQADIALNAAEDLTGKVVKEISKTHTSTLNELD